MICEPLVSLGTAASDGLARAAETSRAGSFDDTGFPSGAALAEEVTGAASASAVSVVAKK